MRTRRRFGAAILGLVALGALLGGAAPARAGIILQETDVLTDSTGTVTAVLGPSGGTIGFTVDNVTAAGGVTTASGPGTVTNPTTGALLSKGFASITNASAASVTVHIVVTANGFTAPTPAAATVSLSGQWLAATGSSITGHWYEDPNNGLSTVTAVVGAKDYALNAAGNLLPVNDTANPLGQAGPTNPPGNFFTATTGTLESFSFQESGLSLPSNTPFGMTVVFDVTLTPGATLQNVAISELALPAAAPPPAVPEPSSLALLVLGGGALAGWRRWRKRKAT